MEKLSFNYRNIYRIIYFSNTLKVLVKPEREYPNIALETDYSLRKDLKNKLIWNV